MSTTMMPSTTMSTQVTRTTPAPTRGVSHFMPMLLALALLVATGVISVLIAGPMH